MARIRTQFGLRQVNVIHTVLDQISGAPTAEKYEVATISENRAFRMFNATTPNPVVGGKPILTDWVQVSFVAPRFIAPSEFSMDPDAQNAHVAFMVEAMLRDGLLVDGELYVRCIRSASQVRAGEALFVRASLDRDAVRYATSFGAKFGKLKGGKVVENLAKMEARYGLASSSSLDTLLVLGDDLSYEIRPDFERTINVEVFGKGSQAIGVTPTDGMGLIRPTAAVRVAASIDLIKPKTAEYFLHVLHTQGYCAAMDQDATFRATWLMDMPSAFQVRCAGVKGLQVVYPFDELHGVDKDLVIAKSQWKYDYADGMRPTLEICSWQKPAKSPFVRLNYQFVQALALTGGQLVGLAQKALTLLSATVLTVPENAMAFLGMIASCEDDGDFSSNLVSMLTRTLNSCPAMLNDFEVQKKLRALLKKWVTDMRLGKIPVSGEYRYIIGDPTLFFWAEMGYNSAADCAGVLASGENYMDGIIGVYGAFRSPLIDKSEPCLLPMVMVGYWHALGLFQGLTVLNSHDDTCHRAGGADVDGDKMLFTDEPAIVGSITEGALLMTEAREGTFSEINWANMTHYDLATAGGSLIGSITNLATTKVDRALCEVERLRALPAPPADTATFALEAQAEAPVADAREAFEILEDNCPF